MQKYFIMFGPPGAGKGTHAAPMVKRYHLKHISTGELLRSEIAAGTELGKQAKALIEKGELVPDEVVEGMIAGVFAANPDVKGFLLDGFPRTVQQAQTLEFLFSKLKRKIDCIVAIDVPRDELVRRIHERAAISGRADDTEEVIRHRIELYDLQTQPVLDYYRVSGLLVTVDGSGEIAETNGRICQTLDMVMNLKKR